LYAGKNDYIVMEFIYFVFGSLGATDLKFIMLE